MWNKKKPVRKATSLHEVFSGAKVGYTPIPPPPPPQHRSLSGLELRVADLEIEADELRTLTNSLEDKVQALMERIEYLEDERMAND